MRRMSYAPRGRIGRYVGAGSTVPMGSTAPMGATGVTSGPVMVTAGSTGMTGATSAPTSNAPARSTQGGSMQRWQGHRGGMGGGWMRGPLLPFIAGAAAAYILIRLSR